jgi:hypothetical protein
MIRDEQAAQRAAWEQSDAEEAAGAAARLVVL